MCEVVERAHLERHPAWGPYGDPGDRELILGSGVAADVLDAALSRFDDCGPALLFPLPLDDGRLPDKTSMMVAARFTTAAGADLHGWVMEPHAFGLYAADRELAFNRTLVRGAAEKLEELSRLLAIEAAQVFPLRFETDLRRVDGSALCGTIEDVALEPGR